MVFEGGYQRLGSLLPKQVFFYDGNLWAVVRQFEHSTYVKKVSHIETWGTVRRQIATEVATVYTMPEDMDVFVPDQLRSSTSTSIDFTCAEISQVKKAIDAFKRQNLPLDADTSTDAAIVAKVCELWVTWHNE